MGEMSQEMGEKKKKRHGTEACWSSVTPQLSHLYSHCCGSAVGPESVTSSNFFKLSPTAK